MRSTALPAALVLAVLAAPRAAPARPAAADPLAQTHRAHPDSRAEWWYYTGHLETASREELGFELTFFRAKLGDGDDLDAAHFALTDVRARSFRWAEKIHRPFPGIAGADPARLSVFIEDWEIREENGAHLLRASMPEASIELRLEPRKPAVQNGAGGLSRKGPGPDEYSHYVSIPLLSVSGTLVRKGKSEPVGGIAWFDHEFGPGGQPKDLAGWDWFAIQLADGTEAMLYRLRTKSGGESPFSQGTFVAGDGAASPLAAGDFAVEATGSWRSPRSGASYPSGWRVRIPSRGIDLTVTPQVRDQELVTTRSTRVTYWEGACSVSGTANGVPVTGKSYVELTGYAGRDLP